MFIFNNIIFILSIAELYFREFVVNMVDKIFSLKSAFTINALRLSCEYAAVKLSQEDRVGIS